MNKRKYRDVLIRLRKIEKNNLEAIITQLSAGFELFKSQFEPMRPINIGILERLIETEELAQELHEAGREAVEKKMTVVASLGLETPSKFLEWNEITEDAKEGRRIQARYLLNVFKITTK